MTRLLGVLALLLVIAGLWASDLDVSAKLILTGLSCAIGAFVVVAARDIRGTL